MGEQALHQQMMHLVANMGDFGVFVAMLLESSIVPLPSEVVIFGSLGSTLGGCVGYCLGRYAVMPVILKFGRFILLKPHHIYRAEAFAKKYGIASVFIGRLLPVVPFKVFSIAAGITQDTRGAVYLVYPGGSLTAHVPFGALRFGDTQI